MSEEVKNVIEASLVDGSDRKDTVADVCDVTVVIPTYQEAENLPVLVPRVHEALLAAGLRGEVIVVDDNSPDATPEVCEELARRYPIRLEVRTRERGLSTAVIHGMQLARGEVLLCMDADLSHPPEKIGEMVQMIASNEADFVIGSRYVPGAGTDQDWGLFRWLNSRVATWLARPLTSACDPMAGFFALRQSTFLAADQLDPVGYKIGLELIVKCHCRSVREIPIHFHDRLHGTSKLNLREQWNYLIHLKRLLQYRYRNLACMTTFGIVGASGMVVDLISFSIFLIALPHALARALAILLAMSWNFVLNRQITFRDRERRSVLKDYLRFSGACSLGAVANWGVSVGLIHFAAVFAERPIAAAVVGIAAGFVFNFALCRLWVFPSNQIASATNRR